MSKFLSIIVVSLGLVAGASIAQAHDYCGYDDTSTDDIFEELSQDGH